MKRSWWLILFLGVIVRLILATATFHPDFRPFQFSGQVIASGNIGNLYDYLDQVKDEKIHQIVLLNYPPAIYWTFGLYSFVVANILHMGLLNDFLIERAGDFGNIWFSLHLLLVKSIYLFFDIPCAFLLAKLFENSRNKLAAFTFWMFNPVNLMATYMMGQFDVIPVFFTIYCLVLAKKQRFYLAALMLGFGIAYKIYPFYLLIPLILVKKTWEERVKIGGLGALPYIMSILPYLGSKGYRTTALLAGQSLKSFFAQLPVSGGEAIFLFPTVLFMTYLLYYYRGVTNLARSFLIVLLVFFIFTHTHPQWLLWLTPLLIINLISGHFKNGLLVLVILLSWFGLLFFFDPSLTVGFFAPIWPQLYNSESIWQWWHLNLDFYFARSLLQSIFVSAAAFLIFRNIYAEIAEAGNGWERKPGH